MVCVQDVDELIVTTEEARGSHGSSLLFANVLKGPDPISAPAPPAGPIGTGDLCCGLQLIKACSCSTDSEHWL